MSFVRYAIVIAAAFMLAACGEHYSDGERIGVVTKISHKGLIWKSWEGHLNVGGMRKETDSNGNSSLAPNVMEFNVQDAAVLEVVKSAAESGSRVKLTYKQWFLKPLTIESSYVITEAKIID